jgi:hypothetical protein
MAIIATDEKVFMVSNSTNTTYSGSAALKAMNQWYTMQDVIDTVTFVGNVATLQAVTATGNTTNIGIVSSVAGLATGISGTSVAGNGVTGYSDTGIGVNGQITTSGVGVQGQIIDGFAAVVGDARGLATGPLPNYGIYGISVDGVGGYFSSDNNYSIVAAQDAAKPGGGAWTATSDSRVKENVKPYTKGLTEILLVNPVNYEYNGLAGTTKGKEFTGVIAQEIKDIFPETVNTYKAKLNEEDEEKTELYNFESTALTFALINAVKELKAEIDLLKSK